jgi:hypothetical protein
VSCPDKDFTTGLLALGPTGMWRLEHQSAGKADWQLIAKNDEFQAASH